MTIPTNDALVWWGILALLSVVFSIVGVTSSWQALIITRQRWDGAGAIGQEVVRRDLIMLACLLLASLVGLATGCILLWLIPHYGNDLIAVLDHLAAPVLLAYAGYAAQTALVTVVAPTWLISRQRNYERSAPEGC